ncbi:hypothetical protein [Roseixanthobacter pseudopolyaromaticivorans]|uniref:hypothetical protein n=1 Tax=Xanthobacteraceae TaxID=335928 RepID=UPI003728EA43
MGYTVPATVQHARDLCPLLRKADRAEVLALTGAPPELILPACVGGDAWAMFTDTHELAGLCGVDHVVNFPGIGIVWMLGSDLIAKHQRDFLAHAKLWVEDQHQRYPLLTNMVDARNTRHIRWLEWMGFTMLRRVERWGAASLPFIEFERRICA